MIYLWPWLVLAACVSAPFALFYANEKKDELDHLPEDWH
jgi:hypothetical protein